jgi:serine protease Do
LLPDKAAGGNDPNKEEKELSAKEIVKRVNKSIALVESPTGNGSGFMIAPGILATNAHVVSRHTVDQLKISFPSAGEEGKKAITPDYMLSYDWKRDLALLAIENKQAPLKLADDFKFESGDKVTAIGSPGAAGQTMKNAVSSGILSTETKVDGQDYYQLSIAINPGNSGGPIFDSRGRVIGVATLKDTSKEGMAFCIPVAAVQKALDKVKTQSKETNTQVTSDFNARVVFCSIAKASILYFRGTKDMVTTWNEANRVRGRVTKEELDKVRDNYLGQLQRNRQLIALLVMKQINSSVAKVGADRLIAEATRQKLAEFWTNYESLRDNFFSPPIFNGLVPYFDNWKKCGEKHDQLLGSLRVTLGVDEEELR